MASRAPRRVRSSSSPRQAAEAAPEGRRAQPAPSLVSVVPYSQASVVQLQRLVGNQATGRYLARRTVRRRPGEEASTASNSGLIQRGPPDGQGPAPATTGGPAPAPATSPPAGAPAGQQPAPSGEGGLTAWGLLSGAQKVKFGLPDWNMVNERAGENFPWSVSRPGKQNQAPLAFGVIPAPLPVGPIELKLEGGLSAYAGGNATLTVRLEQIEMEATIAELNRLGIASFFAVTGMPILSLASLVGLTLKGRANMKARATATLEAGAEANLTALADPTIWPIAGYGKAALGAFGAIKAGAQFEAAVPIELSLGGFKITGGAWDAKAALQAEFGLRGSLSAGIKYGYQLPIPGVDTSGRFELIRYDANVLKRPIDIEKVAEGGDRQMHMMAGGDGVPRIDLDPIITNATRILSALWEATRDQGPTSTTQPPSGDPNVPRQSAPGIGEIDQHGDQPPRNRAGAPIWHTESEHLIPFAIGTRLWDVIDVLAPGRGSRADRLQRTIMIYRGAATRKTAVDQGLIRRFENQFDVPSITRDMDIARANDEDASRGGGSGNPGARERARELVLRMHDALETIRGDAVSRTNQAIADENQSITQGNAETNGQRRGAPGSPEPPIPDGGQVEKASNSQFADIFNLARGAVQGAPR